MSEPGPKDTPSLGKRLLGAVLIFLFVALILYVSRSAIQVGFDF